MFKIIYDLQGGSGLTISALGRLRQEGGYEFKATARE